MPEITNLPGTYPELQDGNLSILQVVDTPSVLVIGTAGSGPTGVYRVKRSEEALAIFGRDGTLGRGIVETSKAGSLTVFGYRVGATAASITFIGNDNPGGKPTKGVTVTTVEKDDSIGDDYYISWDDTAQILRIWDLAGNLLFSNEPGAEVDAGELGVQGDTTGCTGDSFGTMYTGIKMSLIPSTTSATYTVYVPGTDGLSLTRKQLFEVLQDAYRELETIHADIIVPMDIYLDDANIVDNAAISDLTDDYLTYYKEVEEDDGSYTKTWSDTPTTDYHEVNFAYQLANFCYQLTKNEWDCIGIIGVRPPASRSHASVTLWVGKLPTKNTAGTITVNGTGLLGNKFMLGTTGRAPGFFATNSEFLDGTAVVDELGNSVDIGKHLSIATLWPVHFNAFDVTGYGYLAPACTDYAGLISNLDSKSAPTNKVLNKNIALPAELTKTKLDKLSGAHYVTFQTKAQGVVVVDAVTAATTASDYQRLTTVRITNDVIRMVRSEGEPFLGEGNTTVHSRQALQSVLEGKLGDMKKLGYLQRYSIAVTATASQQVQGQATVEVILVPAFELRRIRLVISLAAQ